VANPDPFSDMIARLATGLAQKLLEASAGRVKRAFTGDERQQALQQALAQALAQSLSSLPLFQQEQAHLDTIFTDYLYRPEVVDELCQLLDPRPETNLDLELLLAEFRGAGYDPESLPGFSLGGFLTRLVSAFHDAASQQPALQGAIQIGWLRDIAKRMEALYSVNERSAESLQCIDKNLGRLIERQSTPDPTALRLSYLNRLLESAGRLSLTGIDPRAASEAEARLSLSAVYTALLTSTPEPQERREIGQMSWEWEGRRSSALEQLDRQPRLVLLGDPGSGKSTFVNFVALCLAGEALGRPDANLGVLTMPLPPEEDARREGKPTPQPWRHGALLPVRVVLRDFAARGLPTASRKASADDLWRFVAAELGEALADYAPHMRRELLEQGGLLLLDGLDEVPEAEQRRLQIKQAVEDFAAAFPKCRLLVTSRTYAYQKQDWRLRGFAEAVLARFSRGQIRQFVERWYAHIAGLRDLDPQDARGRAELLQRAIFNSDRLLDLAERPLLLTLMASLHAWRGGSLPEKREALYADTVDLLLDWWESPKVVLDARGEVVMRQPSLAEWLKIDRQKVRDLLNELAFRAHAAQTELHGTADIAEDDLVGRLMRLSQNPQVNPAQLVEYLSLRAGLLLPRGVGVYTFPHRTFQEYLAACYLTDHEYPDQIADLVRDNPNRWREVTLLAGAKAARGTASAIWSLADALCFREPGVEAGAEDYWGALLAGQALAETADLARIGQRNWPKAERVRRWLVHILHKGFFPAVERALAGEALAALGDPRFRPELWHLPEEPLLGFVPIPAGPFIMGSKPGDEDSFEDEQPQHEVSLPLYYLARYPVTAVQFRLFVQDSGYQPGDKDSLEGIANHPVVDVTWHDALAYCRWLGEKLSAVSQQRSAQSGLSEGERDFWAGLAEGRLQVCLPSEAEWEKAARGPLPSPPPPSPWKGEGPGMRVYPWGDEFDPDKANTSETGLGATSAVGCFPAGASPYGLLDMSGDVWEWTLSRWGRNINKPDFTYPYDPKDGREDPGSPDLRVVRGGSFDLNHGFARCACRGGDGPGGRGGDLGFRVVVSPI